MKIYHYDGETGELLGDDMARPDPMEAGRFLIPANATDIRPPYHKKGYARIFAGQWSYVKDVRGAVVYIKETGERREWDELGEMPDTVTTIAPTEYGSTWDGSTWVAPPPPVPQVVSRFQARAALHQSGRLAEVEAAIAGADVITQMAWQDAQEFRRNSPTILALGDILDLDLDALFTAAAEIAA